MALALFVQPLVPRELLVGVVMNCMGSLRFSAHRFYRTHQLPSRYVRIKLSKSTAVAQLDTDNSNYLAAQIDSEVDVWGYSYDMLHLPSLFYIKATQNLTQLYIVHHRRTRLNGGDPKPYHPEILTAKRGPG